MKDINFYSTILTIAIMVVFLTLKIAGVIAWSWWWVTAPVWIPAVLAIIAVILSFILIKYYGRT